tara:strand:- start:549 stop:827 length:279 start_codon:yes stop_codon:yes gene_type:complete
MQLSPQEAMVKGSTIKHLCVLGLLIFLMNRFFVYDKGGSPSQQIRWTVFTGDFQGSWVADIGAYYLIDSDFCPCQTGTTNERKDSVSLEITT